MTGPDDDPHDRPTRMTEIVAEDSQQVPEREPSAAMGDEAPRPWYRNRVLLALWALMVALLFTLIIYGIVELSRGGGETSVPPKTTTSTTTTPSTTSPSPTTTTEPPPTGTTGPPPPPESTEQSPEEAPPPPPTNTPAPTSPSKHHHHWHLPHFS